MYLGLLQAEIEFDRSVILTIVNHSPMTVKAKAAIKQFHSDRFALRDKVAAHLAASSSADRLKTLMNAGVLNKQGKLTASYRPKPLAA